VVAVGKEAEHENVFKQYSKQAEFVLNTLLWPSPRCLSWMDFGTNSTHLL
jgi:hypothetical protein